MPMSGDGRSAAAEVLTWEVGQHPLVRSGYDGVVVRGYHIRLQRSGRISLVCTILAFCSWHALGRMAERSKIDVFTSRGLIVGCGIAGLLMRESEQHFNTAIHLVHDELLVAGVLRIAPDEDEADKGYGFLDVLTAYQPHEDGPQVGKWQQGRAITVAVNRYLLADDADPTGYADGVEVLPRRADDYVSRELKLKEPRPCA
jgi:hypothetical protein